MPTTKLLMPNYNLTLKIPPPQQTPIIPYPLIYLPNKFFP